MNITAIYSWLAETSLLFGEMDMQPNCTSNSTLFCAILNLNTSSMQVAKKYPECSAAAGVAF